MVSVNAVAAYFFKIFRISFLVANNDAVYTSFVSSINVSSNTGVARVFFINKVTHGVFIFITQFSLYKV
jgi:hypothetical protein